MSKKIAVDISKESYTFTFTNTYGTDEYKDYAIAPKAIEGLEDTTEGYQWNTGKAMVGDPYIDEYLNKGKALVDEVDGFAGLHAFALRLFGGNQYFTLLPGDSIKLAAKGQAALYYATIKGDGIKVEATPTVITEGEDREDNGPVFTDDADEEYFDRTTGVGDDGDPINFDSEAYTEEISGSGASL